MCKIRNYFHSTSFYLIFLIGKKTKFKKNKTSQHGMIFNLFFLVSFKVCKLYLYDMSFLSIVK